MSDRTMDECMPALGPLLGDFDAITKSAHTRYRAYPASELVEHSSRAAAICTYDHMVAEADRRFLDRAGVRPDDIRGLKVWFAHDTVIRFKKMDEDGRGRNYPTKQAKAYDRGEELPGLPYPPIRLTVGYLLDRTGTQFVRSQVARPEGKSILWCAAIIPTEERSVGERAWKDVTRQFRMGG